MTPTRAWRIRLWRLVNYKYSITGLIALSIDLAIRNIKMSQCIEIMQPNSSMHSAEILNIFGLAKYLPEIRIAESNRGGHYSSTGAGEAYEASCRLHG
jgi:hypothetical protein